MVFDISTAITWMLFLALFPMAFVWLRGAYRIFIKKDYSTVAVKGGEPPDDPEKYAPFAGLINLAAGCSAVIAILGVVAALFDYKTWSAIAGVTIWMKVFADFVLSRQAHPFKFGKDKTEEVANNKK